MVKVTKFGGSSVASADQLKKVFNIVKSDPERRIIIVSAPGKRYDEDIKVTDLLIVYANAFLNKEGTNEIEEQIVRRYKDISDELGLSLAMPMISDHIYSLKNTPHTTMERVMDLFKSSGENCQAMLVAEFLTANGLPAVYVNPQDAGILVEDIPGDAIIKEEAYEKIIELSNLNEIAVIPGFFGYTTEGEVCTFSRGGSDVTGSIIAAGVKAAIYENFTDVDAIYAADPRLVSNCFAIKELTFKEMRELSYSGFGVLHHEALIPAFHADIPVVIKNTNNPKAPGTMISSSRQKSERPVVGIAGDSGFTSIYLSKYLMNRQLGFGFDILKILKEFHLQYEHMPSGIDNVTLILRKNQLTPEIEKQLIIRLKEYLDLDEIKVKHDISMIAIVGEGMKNSVGIAGRATSALAKSDINIEMINQGSSEVSILFAVNEDQEKEAIQALYHEFF